MSSSPDAFERISHSPEEGDKKKRAVDVVRRFMKKSEEYRRPHLDLAKKSRELYQCWDSQAKSPIQRANLKLPYGYTIIESETPQICEIFLKEKPFFKWSGQEPQDMQWENGLTDFTAMQLEAMRLPVKLVSFVKGMKLDGTAVAKVPWRYKEAVVLSRVPQQDPLTGEVFMSKQPEMQVLFDGPDFEYIPLVDFFPDWAAREPGNIDAHRGVVHRTWQTFSELKAKRKKKTAAGYTDGVYENIPELELSISTKGCDAWAHPYGHESWWDKKQDNVEDVKKKPIEVWEYWGLFDPNGDGNFEEYIITLANGDTVVRCEPTFIDAKLKPFVACPNVLRDGEFYGIPELIAVRGLIKEAQALRNARLDQANLAINRMYIVDRAAGIKARSLYSKPGGVVYTNDMQGIRELPPPEVPASSYRELQEINTEIQAVTGMPNSPGLSDAGRVFGRSATGASLVQSFAGSRIGMSARLISECLFKPLARLMFAMNKQYITDEKWVRVSDPNKMMENPFSVLPPDAFHCNYDFEIVSTFEAGADQEMAKLQQLTQLLQVAEGSQPGITKWDVLMEDLARALVGPKSKKFMRSEEELMQMQLNKLAGEQAANAMIGQMAPQPNSKPPGA
jgi:hypothetical protein